ncbi:MAG: response regulator [Parabacteroides sp.]|nr:response regulator [Parabacteroides sp.]
MNKQFAICLRSILILLFGSVSTEVSPIYFRHIGMEEGLSHFTVLSVYQDILGRMWFGTNEGLTVYNGSRIHVFKPDFDLTNEHGLQRIKENRITSIHGDGEGNVFFLAGHSLIRYDIRKETFSQIRDAHVTALTSFHGKIGCAAHDSVFVYNPETDRLEFFLKTSLPLITQLGVFSGDRLWIGTRNGLYVTGKNRRIRCVIPDIMVYSLFRSSRKEVWVSSRRKGLYRITEGEKVEKIPYDTQGLHGVVSNQVRQLTEDNDGNLWIGTFEGLQRYDPERNEFELYTCENVPGSLSHASVFPVYKDRQGTVWVGTYYGGVNYFNPENDIFTYYPAGALISDEPNYSLVGDMAEDRDGRLWICTEGGGLSCLDRNMHQFSQYTASATHANSLPHNNLKSIAYDSIRHTLYIGTHTGGFSAFDLNTRMFRNYLPRFRAGEKAPGDIIDQVACYGSRVVIAARNGTFVMDTQADTFALFGKGESCRIFDIDSAGNVWMLRDETLVLTGLDNPSSRKTFDLSRYGIDFPVTCLLAGRKGILYLCTSGAGLYRFDAESETVIHYTAGNSSLLSNYCYNMKKASTGEFLITSDKGIMLFNSASRSVKAVRLREGMPLTSVVENCGICICRDDEIFVGGTNGMISFKEEELNKQQVGSRLYFTDLFLNNKPVYPGDTTRILSQSLPFTSRINLRHRQNNLVFRFTEPDYSSALKNNLYEYQLEGFDKEWIATTGTTLNYTNLSPGDYLLKIRKALLLPGDNPAETVLGVHIRRPWYATGWAWSLYSLCAFLLLYIIWKVKRNRLELAMSLREERNEKERIEKLNQAKLRFFTNISHEFRTPLTLIISHLDALVQNNRFSSATEAKLRKVYLHTDRMRTLITELLDFRKFDQQQVALHVSEQNIVPWLKTIYLSYSDMAAQRAVYYSFVPAREEIGCWFDPSQMQKVIYNLLSNAFKYTSDGGKIELAVLEDDAQVIIQVIDNGTGLSAEDKKQVFERFYQGDNNLAAQVNPGTGIGLALTKSIVQLHRGNISVESSPGYGTIFTVTLKKGRTHLNAVPNIVFEETLKQPGIRTGSLPAFGLSAKDGEEECTEAAGLPVTRRHTVLLVEDNEELMQVLISLFSPFYTVLSAFNGKEGLEKATTESPDLIVCDVMMPVMNGKEMCRRIKNDIRLCHTPVVLLSALNTDEHNIEGLRCGADDYIGKPFNARVLLLRCNNLLRNRYYVKNKLTEQADFDIQVLATNPLDKEFLSRATAIVERHLDENDFDIMLLSKEMGFGRSSFYTKFKALTGITPGTFILDYRLKKAAVLLVSHPEMQIAEIAVRLGFNTSQYFSKCFKAQFKASPLDYRKNKLRGNG